MASIQDFELCGYPAIRVRPSVEPQTLFDKKRNFYRLGTLIVYFYVQKTYRFTCFDSSLILYLRTVCLNFFNEIFRPKTFLKIIFRNKTAWVIFQQYFFLNAVDYNGFILFFKIALLDTVKIFSQNAYSTHQKFENVLPRGANSRAF